MTTELVVVSVEAAYQDAYEEHWHDVFQFALAWTNDWAAAEDLTQESYLRLWTNRTRVDWGPSIVPWLITTTKHLATDRLRALRRRAIRGPKPATLDEGIIQAWLDVQSAMANLSPLERVALVLTTLKGLPYGDAAAMLGTSPGAVRAAVSIARDKLEAA